MKLTKKSFYVYKFKKSTSNKRSTLAGNSMVASGQEMVRGKKFFKVGETSRNFLFSQGKFKSLTEVREK